MMNSQRYAKNWKSEIENIFFIRFNKEFFFKNFDFNKRWELSEKSILRPFVFTEDIRKRKS